MDGFALSTIDALPNCNAISKGPRAAAIAVAISSFDPLRTLPLCKRCTFGTLTAQATAYRTSALINALLCAKEPQDSVYGLFRSRTFVPEISGARSRNPLALFCEPETLLPMRLRRAS
jgi:hypothetical protein